MNILDRIKRGEKGIGVYSCCSSNHFVLEATMTLAQKTNTDLLVESTANQVNQSGGYTGMTPLDFRRYVTGLAENMNFPTDRLILGGDHLGPLTWKHLPEPEAMGHAKRLVEDYVAAGFTKIHLDTSMRLASDDQDKPLSDAVIAGRAAFLCLAAEETFGEIKKTNPEAKPPYYVIGSEVPVPGGAQENHNTLEITRPEDFIATIESFRSAFSALNLNPAWDRVIGAVVQPGVEFSDTEVIRYDSPEAQALCRALDRYPNLVFEGHSTDYQTRESLRAMARDGIAILKVGPALTFALRQGLFALEYIESELILDSSKRSDFRKVLEAVMLEKPVYWKGYYNGNEEELRFKRAFSQSDRCRYYLNDPRVESSIDLLIGNLSGADIPLTLLSQFLPAQCGKVREGQLAKTPLALLWDVIGNTVEDYLYAVAY
ncbi:MAG TPA: class II D-tagatose-bisphosphate aldolase, non-catalytic subunit [Anaerovoracaceae bacterium]|nr:class II D-tagatose-bisphosphate aldolase, non-catalytic subunit [Anaerovoracaceae bacterium]